MGLIKLSFAVLISLVLVLLTNTPAQANGDTANVDVSIEILAYQVTDLTAGNPTQDSIDLTWTTPEAGTKVFSYFDIRYSKTNITPENWHNATRAVNEPEPVPDTSQGMKIRGLDSNTTYYFSMKIIDNEGLVSVLSNVASTATLAAPSVDETPPARITDLAANPGSPAATAVILGWTAPGDDENTGTVNSYEIRRSSSEITDTNWSSATILYNSIIPQSAGGSESFVVSRLNPGTTYYFAVRAKDEVGNLSPTSNSPSITTVSNLPVINNISPNSGDNSQRRTVNVIGSNFIVGGNNVVRFVSGNNTFDLVNVNCSSSTQLTADIGKGAPIGSYRVRVINSNGTSDLSTATYEITAAPIPLPEVNNLIPQMAASNTPVSGVQVFGVNLTGATAVSFGNIETAGFTVVDDSKITADVPGLAAGEYDVKVTTPAGTNEVSSVKFTVSDPVVINEETTEDTTTSEVVELETDVIPVQLTLTTDEEETAIQSTDVDADIEVVIPPQTRVTCEGEAYTGKINPPRVVKPDESVLTDLTDDAVVIEMGNPEKTIDFDQDFVTTVIITASVKPVIWYFNKTTGVYELAGKDGTKDGIDYLPGGIILGQENSTYTMGLLLEHMSPYIAGVKPRITDAPEKAITGQDIKITGANFHPTAVNVYFNDYTGTIVSRSYTQIVVKFDISGSYTLRVKNPDELSDSRDINIISPAAPGGGAAPIVPELPPGTTDVSEFVTTAGLFTSSISATSEDGLYILTIPEDTVGLTRELGPLTTISIIPTDEPPPPPEGSHVIGLAYDIQPGGATFEPPITLECRYDQDNIPKGITEKNLFIACYEEDTGEWIELDSTVDIENKIITAQLPHFTIFAVIGTVPEKPVVKEEKPVVEEEEEVPVVEEEEVPVVEEEEKPVVEEEVPVLEEEEVVPKKTNWALIVGIVVGVAVIGLLGYYLWLRRRRQARTL